MSNTGNIQTFFIKEITPHYIGPRLKIDTIRDATDAAVFIRKVLKDNAREHFIALYLDGKHSPVSYSVISIGTANASLCHAREIFQMAVLSGACAFLCAHNHPSGDLVPSQEDHLVTRRLKEAGELLGIKLLDHIIVTDSAHFSFNETGQI